MFDLSLYLVTDRGLSKGRDLEFVVREAVEGGVTMVQLREKDCSTNEFTELALKLKSILKSYQVPLIINDDLGVALASDADGLHVGQGDISYLEAREILGPDKIIGLSVETIEQARIAEEIDVDYLGISPVFSTYTKTDIKTPLGLEGIREIASFSRHPLVAIGGIHLLNTAAILDAGADGVAVVSAIVSADNIKQAASELKQMIEKQRSK